MRSLTSACIVACAVTMLGGAPSAFAQIRGVHVSEYISPETQQYLALRKANPPFPGLSLQSLAENPSAYRGKTLEIDGVLTGTCSADDGLTRLMLTTDTAQAISLTMSQVPDWVRSGERLRVLVFVVGSNDPDTVEYGIPEMEIVAVASAWELRAMEERARERQNAASAAESARQNARIAARSRRIAASLPSRKSASRISSASYTSYTVPANGLSESARRVFPDYREFIRSRNSRLTDQQVNDITWAVLVYSEQLDMDPRLVIALIIAESDFDPGSTSHTGAMGLGQLMPDTAREIASKTGLSNPYDPVQNIAGSIWLLRSHLATYSGGKAMVDLNMQNIALALAAYNAGPGAVRKYGGVPPYRETQNYVRKIASIYRQLCGKAG